MSVLIWKRYRSTVDQNCIVAVPITAVLTSNSSPIPNNDSDHLDTDSSPPTPSLGDTVGIDFAGRGGTKARPFVTKDFIPVASDYFAINVDNIHLVIPHDTFVEQYVLIDD